MSGFEEHDLLTGTWLKIGEHGYSFRVTFHGDGTFTELGLFADSGVSWDGRWVMDFSPPAVVIRAYLPPSDLYLIVTTPHGTYQLGINRSRDGLHSGLERRYGDPHHEVRFKFVHVQP